MAHQRGAIDGTKGVHAPAIVDNQALALFLCHIFHPRHCVDPGGPVQIERCEEQVGVRCLAGIVAIDTTSGSDARHMGTMGGITIEAEGVALRGDEVVAVGVFGAVVKACRCGSSHAELVPGLQDTAVVLAIVVVVGVRVVETPVGDADKNTLAGVGLGQPETAVHTVGAGIVARFVQQRLDGTCLAVYQHFCALVEQVGLVRRQAQGDDIARP